MNKRNEKNENLNKVVNNFILRDYSLLQYVHGMKWDTQKSASHLSLLAHIESL